MAFSSISSTGKATYFENLMSNKGIATSYFGVHLARRQPSGSSVSSPSYRYTSQSFPSDVLIYI